MHIFGLKDLASQLILPFYNHCIGLFADLAFEQSQVSPTLMAMLDPVS